MPGTPDLFIECDKVTSVCQKDISYHALCVHLTASVLVSEYSRFATDEGGAGSVVRGGGGLGGCWSCTCHQHPDGGDHHDTAERPAQHPETYQDSRFYFHNLGHFRLFHMP